MERFGQIQWLKLMFLALIYPYSAQAYNRMYDCAEFPFVNSECSHASGSQVLKKNQIKKPKHFKSFV